jgi:hypothetical protein
VLLLGEYREGGQIALQIVATVAVLLPPAVLCGGTIDGQVLPAMRFADWSPLAVTALPRAGAGPGPERPISGWEISAALAVAVTILAVFALMCRVYAGRRRSARVPPG